MARKRSEHYVNNKEFLAAIVESKRRSPWLQKEEKRNLVSQIILGNVFLRSQLIYLFKPNFVNYMFKDDMVCDGIENCVQYINNFKSRKNLRILLLTLLR